MKKNSLSKKEILVNSVEFKNVIFKGLRFLTQIFGIYIKTTDNLFCRVGISVSKKTGNSVMRNRIKRVVREWFRINKNKFNKSFDMVFIFKNKTNKDDVSDINKSINQIIYENNITNTN